MSFRHLFGFKTLLQQLVEVLHERGQVVDGVLPSDRIVSQDRRRPRHLLDQPFHLLRDVAHSGHLQVLLQEGGELLAHLLHLRRVVVPRLLVGRSKGAAFEPLELFRRLFARPSESSTLEDLLQVLVESLLLLLVLELAEGRLRSQEAPFGRFNRGRRGR